MLETTDLLKSANGRFAPDIPGLETDPAPVPVPPPSDSGGKADPYRQVVLVLFAFALLGAAGAVYAGRVFRIPVLLDTAVTLGLSAAILIGVRVTRTAWRIRLSTPSWRRVPSR